MQTVGGEEKLGGKGIEGEMKQKYGRGEKQEGEQLRKVE